MPVTWCNKYPLSDESYCSIGFPMGCYIHGVPRLDEMCMLLIGVFIFI